MLMKVGAEIEAAIAELLKKQMTAFFEDKHDSFVSEINGQQ